MEKKIIFTQEAEKQLAVAHKDFEKQLLKIIRSKNHYPGDDIIEVTASDIDISMKDMRFTLHSKVVLNTFFKFILFLLCGTIMSVLGIFYNTIIGIILNNPERLLFLVCGVWMLLVSFYMFIKFRLASRGII